MYTSSNGVLPPKHWLGSREFLMLSYHDKHGAMYIENVPYAFRLGVGDIAASNERLLTVVKDLAKHVALNGLTLTSDVCRRFLEAFSREGMLAYKTYFTDYAKNALSSAMSAVQNPDQPQRLPPFTTVRVLKQYSLVWEFVYDGPSAAVDPERFWGFRVPLGRTYWDINPKYSTSLNSGLFIVSHDKLTHFRDEISKIVRHVNDFGNFHGLGVAAFSLEDGSLNASPHATGLLELLTEGDFKYGIIHFACHCKDEDANDASAARLSFTYRGTEFRLTVKDVLLEQRRLATMPLIVLNTCNSGSINHFLEILDFPLSWLERGAAGVIGTLCPVPDVFAAPFGAEFYRNLLRTGKLTSDPFEVSVAEALLETRLHFLHKHHNPLGLIYGLHAPAQQRITAFGRPGDNLPVATTAS